MPQSPYSVKKAIYGWRGANPTNMEVEFEKDFPGCETVFMSRNYRLELQNLF
jgi:superfamily I DNA/RNA helicase